jgi:serine/threonine-protein kinase
LVAEPEPWEVLARIVDQEVYESLGDDFEAFRARTGTEDGDLFVQYLYRIGRLPKDRLGEALRLRGRPELSDPDSLRRQRTKGDAATFVPRSPEGGYALLGKVGEGSMGRVFVAKDHDLHRKVAFKQMSATYAKDPRLKTRFLNEVQITAQLDHPNVVPVYDLEVDAEGRFGYAMKLVEGRTMAELLAERETAWSEGSAGDESGARAELLEILLKVCDAMAYGHNRGVVHRDLKPDNIMVGPFGEVYVMDWGLARLMGAAEIGGAVMPMDSGLTRVGDAVGTPAYMSPEQAQGKNSELDGRSDMYTLGLILQQICTLRNAMEGSTVADVMLRAAMGRRRPVRHAHGADVPPQLVAIIAKACAPHRDERYPDVEAFAEDIRRFTRGKPVSVYREGLRGSVRRVLERHVVSLVALGFFVVLGASLVAILSLALGLNETYRSAAREEQLQRVLTVASARAHKIDVEMLDYEGLMEGFAASASIALTQSIPEDVPIYLSDQFDRGEGPPDTREARRFGQPVSFALPSFKLAPDADPVALDSQLRRLVRLRHQAAATLRRSTPLGADLSDTDGPILWIYLGTEDGVQLSYPGHGGYPESFDPRKRPWYHAAMEAEGAAWGTPYIDVNGSGLVLPCSAALVSPEGALLGVAGMDLAFDYLVAELLDPGHVSGATEALLLDPDGNIVLRSGEQRKFEGGVHSGRSLRKQRFEVDSVVDSVVLGQSGLTEESGELFVYYRLDALGWTYVVRGPTRAMLEG